MLVPPVALILSMILRAYALPTSPISVKSKSTIAESLKVISASLSLSLMVLAMVFMACFTKSRSE